MLSAEVQDLRAQITILESDKSSLASRLAETQAHYDNALSLLEHREAELAAAAEKSAPAEELADDRRSAGEQDSEAVDVRIRGFSNLPSFTFKLQLDCFSLSSRASMFQASFFFLGLTSDILSFLVLLQTFVKYQIKSSKTGPGGAFHRRQRPLQSHRRRRVGCRAPGVC